MIGVNKSVFKYSAQLLIYKVSCILVRSKFVEYETYTNHTILWFAAKMGSVNAQYELAMMFRRGKAVVKDNELFQYWAFAAYDQGHVGATFVLAKYYRFNIPGCQRDLKGDLIQYVDLAYELFEHAAEKGMIEAQELLADMHRIGEGMHLGVPNLDMAIHWYNEAASNGSKSAQEMRDYIIKSEGISDWLPDSLKVDWFSGDSLINK